MSFVKFESIKDIIISGQYIHLTNPWNKRNKMKTEKSIPILLERREMHDAREGGYNSPQKHLPTNGKMKWPILNNAFLLEE